MDPYASAHGLFNQASPSSPLIESTGSAERDVRQKIAIWAHEAGVPARSLDNEYFKKFIKALGELGPGFHYQLPTAEEDPNIQHDVEVMDAVLEFFDTIFHGDLEMQHQIINVELPKYKNKEGAFGRELAAKACEVNYDDFDPANWWGTFGGSTPCLRKIAMRILSLTTSSSGCDRNRHTLKRAHMKKMNELTTTQMDNYIFVQFNLNLKSKYKKNKQMNMEVLLASDAKEAQEWLVDYDDSG